MSKEIGHTPNIDPSRVSYEETDVALKATSSETDVARVHYEREEQTHIEIGQETGTKPEDERYAFHDEYNQLLENRGIELSELEKRQKELTAKLQRLYDTARNEANAKNESDNRYKLYQEVLPSVKDMKAKNEVVYLNIDELNRYDAKFVKDALMLSDTLVKFLSEKNPTREDEQVVCLLYKNLCEASNEIANKNFAHSSIPLPK